MTKALQNLTPKSLPSVLWNTNNTMTWYIFLSNKTIHKYTEWLFMDYYFQKEANILWIMEDNELYIYIYRARISQTKEETRKESTRSSKKVRTFDDLLMNLFSFSNIGWHIDKISSRYLIGQIKYIKKRGVVTFRTFKIKLRWHDVHEALSAP